MAVAATKAQIGNVRSFLAHSPEVRSFVFFDRKAALKEFKHIFRKDKRLTDNVTADALPVSFRVYLVHPSRAKALVTQAHGLPGVDSVTVLTLPTRSDAVHIIRRLVCSDLADVDLEVFMTVDATRRTRGTDPCRAAGRCVGHFSPLRLEGRCAERVPLPVPGQLLSRSNSGNVAGVVRTDGRARTQLDTRPQGSIDRPRWCRASDHAGLPRASRPGAVPGSRLRPPGVHEHSCVAEPSSCTSSRHYGPTRTSRPSTTCPRTPRSANLRCVLRYNRPLSRLVTKEMVPTSFEVRVTNASPADVRARLVSLDGVAKRPAPDHPPAELTRPPRYPSDKQSS